MKRISNYKTFINESSSENKLTQKQLDFLNKYVRGKWHLNEEGVVDVDGDFDCFDKGIFGFKGIKFGKITRDFDCSDNNLTSLEGCPEEVGGSFYCNYNNLTSLEGGPEKVGGTFDCSNNSLTSLKFGPKEVEDHFTCSDNNIITLEGSPKKINRSFNCSRNKLTSLEGSPKEVRGFFYFEYNEGVSTEILKSIFSKMIESKLDYSDALESLWKDIPIEDKIILYTPDLDWVEEPEASKLAKIKKYTSIKKML